MGLLGVVATVGTAVATVPLVLQTWSQTTYAVWLAVAATYSLLQTFDIGHSGYLGNEYLRRAHDDPEGYRRAYASGLRLALCLGATQVLLACVILATGLVPRVLGLPLEGTAAREAGLALVALTIGWWASGSLGGVMAGLYFPAGLFVRAQWWAIANKLLMFACVAVPAVLGGGVLAVALTTAVGNIVFALVLWADAVIQVPEARAWREGASWREALRNARRSLVVTGNTASQQLGLSGLVLAVAALLGAAAVPVFTTLRTLANAAAAVTIVVVSPIVPDIVRYHVRQEWRKLLVSFEACWFSVGALVHVGALVTFPIADALFRAWTRGRIAFDPALYALLLWALGVAVVGTPMLRYLQALNRLAAQTACNLAYLGALIVVVPVAARAMGLAGVGAGLVAAEAARTLVSLRYARAEMPATERSRLARLAWYAAAPLAVSGAGLAAAVALPSYAVPVTMTAAIAVVGIYLVQWRMLDPELRVRARSIVPSRVSVGSAL